MDGSKGSSQIDEYFNAIAIFMQSTGAIQAVPSSKEDITDKFMKIVNSDKTLREFANNSK